MKPIYEGRSACLMCNGSHGLVMSVTCEHSVCVACLGLVGQQPLQQQSNEYQCPQGGVLISCPVCHSKDAFHTTGLQRHGNMKAFYLMPAQEVLQARLFARRKVELDTAFEEWKSNYENKLKVDLEATAARIRSNMGHLKASLAAKQEENERLKLESSNLRKELDMVKETLTRREEKSCENGLAQPAVVSGRPRGRTTSVSSTCCSFEKRKTEDRPGLPDNMGKKVDTGKIKAEGVGSNLHSELEKVDSFEVERRACPLKKRLIHRASASLYDAASCLQIMKVANCARKSDRSTSNAKKTEGAWSSSEDRKRSLDHSVLEESYTKNKMRCVSPEHGKN